MFNKNNAVESLNVDTESAQEPVVGTNDEHLAEECSKNCSNPGEMSLEKSVVDLLLRSGLKVTTVESCTGGMVASRLVNISGVSEVFKYSFVTYCDEAKMKLAGVEKETLDKHTAVSRETAYEMVQHLEAPLKSDVCVGVTGYADGEDAGHVFIACNVRGNTEVKEFRFEGNRATVRESAATQALVLIKECVLNYLGKNSLL